MGCGASASLYEGQQQCSLSSSTEQDKRGPDEIEAVHDLVSNDHALAAPTEDTSVIDESENFLAASVSELDQQIQELTANLNDSRAEVRSYRAVLGSAINSMSPDEADAIKAEVAELEEDLANMEEEICRLLNERNTQEVAEQEETACTVDALKGNDIGAESLLKTLNRKCESSQIRDSLCEPLQKSVKDASEANAGSSVNSPVEEDELLELMVAELTARLTASTSQKFVSALASNSGLVGELLPEGSDNASGVAQLDSLAVSAHTLLKDTSSVNEQLVRNLVKSCGVATQYFINLFERRKRVFPDVEHLIAEVKREHISTEAEKSVVRELLCKSDSSTYSQLFPHHSLVTMDDIDSLFQLIQAQGQANNTVRTTIAEMCRRGEWFSDFCDFSEAVESYASVQYSLQTILQNLLSPFSSGQELKEQLDVEDVFLFVPGSLSGSGYLVSGPSNWPITVDELFDVIRETGCSTATLSNIIHGLKTSRSTFASWPALKLKLTSLALCQKQQPQLLPPSRQPHWLTFDLLCSVREIAGYPTLEADGCKMCLQVSRWSPEDDSWEAICTTESKNCSQSTSAEVLTKFERVCLPLRALLASYQPALLGASSQENTSLWSIPLQISVSAGPASRRIDSFSFEAPSAITTTLVLTVGHLLTHSSHGGFLSPIPNLPATFSSIGTDPRLQLQLQHARMAAAEAPAVHPVSGRLPLVSVFQRDAVLSFAPAFRLPSLHGTKDSFFVELSSLVGGSWSRLFRSQEQGLKSGAVSFPRISFSLSDLSGDSLDRPFCIAVYRKVLHEWQAWLVGCRITSVRDMLTRRRANLTLNHTLPDAFTVPSHIKADHLSASLAQYQPGAYSPDLDSRDFIRIELAGVALPVNSFLQIYRLRDDVWDTVWITKAVGAESSSFGSFHLPWACLLNDVASTKDGLLCIRCWQVRPAFRFLSVDPKQQRVTRVGEIKLTLQQLLEASCSDTFRFGTNRAGLRVICAKAATANSFGSVASDEDLLEVNCGIWRGIELLSFSSELDSQTKGHLRRIQFSRDSLPASSHAGSSTAYPYATDEAKEAQKGSVKTKSASEVATERGVQAILGAETCRTPIDLWCALSVEDTTARQIAAALAKEWSLNELESRVLTSVFCLCVGGAEVKPSQQQFEAFASTFGPLECQDGSCALVPRLVREFADANDGTVYSWFWGKAESSEVETALKSAGKGAFLFRLASDPGHLCVARAEVRKKETKGTSLVVTSHLTNLSGKESSGSGWLCSATNEIFSTVQAFLSANGEKGSGKMVYPLRRIAV